MDLINLKSVGIDPVKIEAIQENALAASISIAATASDVRYIVGVVRKLAAQLDKPQTPP